MKTQLLALSLLLGCNLYGNTPVKLKFDFTTHSSHQEVISITPNTLFGNDQHYGYDVIGAPKNNNDPFFFSMNVPDGNYRIKVTLGSDLEAGVTTVRGESRRLFFESVKTEPGESKEILFTINKRNTIFNGNEKVKIKKREEGKPNWDDKLTLEFNGSTPRVRSIDVEQIFDIPTIYLCGNSTVVDQDNEPWASWGQMIPRFFNEKVSFANYAESGESASSFIRAYRLKKIASLMKSGDYIFVEFGHNDQKQKGEGIGAYLSFTNHLKEFIGEARQKGAHPVLVTPTQRRSFNKEGEIVDTHEDYPQAMRDLADIEGIPLIDLHKMTRTLYEALGEKESIKAFVHYPANTFPGQSAALADNTHFNTYGAYQIAQCVIEGMKAANLQLVNHLRADYKGYDPAKPQSASSFWWDPSPFAEIEKPDGN